MEPIQIFHTLDSDEGYSYRGRGLYSESYNRMPELTRADFLLSSVVLALFSAIMVAGGGVAGSGLDIAIRITLGAASAAGAIALLRAAILFGGTDIPSETDETDQTADKSRATSRRVHGSSAA